MKAIKYLDVRILVNKYFQSSIRKLLFSTHINLLDKYTQGFNFKVQRKNKFLRIIKPHDYFINLKPRGKINSSMIRMCRGRKISFLLPTWVLQLGPCKLDRQRQIKKRKTSLWMYAACIHSETSVMKNAEGWLELSFYNILTKAYTFVARWQEKGKCFQLPRVSNWGQINMGRTYGVRSVLVHLCKGDLWQIVWKLRIFCS